MARILAYTFFAVLTVVSFAAPNPAVNRIDAPGHRPHSITTTSLKTALSTLAAPHVTLEPRKAAVNRVDAVGVNVHNKPTSSSAYSSKSQTIVSTTVGPYIALNPEEPAVNIIDAGGVQAYRQTRTRSADLKRSVSFSSPSVRPYMTLNPRDPAVNRIDAPDHKPHSSTLTSLATAIGSSARLNAPLRERDPAINRIDAVDRDAVDQALFSVAGGTPVTLAISDIQQLETAATDVIDAVAVPIPVISVNPAPDNPAVPASFFSPPPPSSNAIPVNVPNTQTTLYIILRPDRPIAKTDMGQTLVHALSDLRETLQQNGANARLPGDDWSRFEEGWDCVLTADRNLIPGPDGREQYLTFGILHSVLVGLWSAMYSKGRYFGCEFEIHDAEWGVVGSGEMDPWGGVAHNLTTS